jgi:hypothetical protein
MVSHQSERVQIVCNGGKMPPATIDSVINFSSFIAVNFERTPTTNEEENDIFQLITRM